MNGFNCELCQDCRYVNQPRVKGKYRPWWLVVRSGDSGIRDGSDAARPCPHCNPNGAAAFVWPDAAVQRAVMEEAEQAEKRTHEVDFDHVRRLKPGFAAHALGSEQRLEYDENGVPRAVSGPESNQR